ncbi:ATPase [Brachyspira hampsonii]|uniref:ATPase n=2 Tax=Brachyspira hampsonii TaxID=1287055 RepID=A0A1E5NJA9_9SPIR|nr:ATPase [Brachyspira hampsonii]
MLNFLKKREVVLAIIICILVIIISALTPNFLNYENISNILKSYTVLGIFALGVLLIIISGGVDVSFTAIAQVVQYIVVYILLNYISGNIYIAFILSIIFGIIFGLFNGFLIYHYKMPAIIITIATQNLFYGILYVVTKGKLLYEVPSYFWSFSDAKLFTIVNANGINIGISLVTILWFVMALIVFFILKYTILGRSIYLIGCNSVAAKRVGISILKTTLFVYVLSAVIAAIGSIVHVSIVQTVIPNSIVGTEMQVIAAVVLGGASITGGKGSVIGTMLGVLLFAILSNSLTLLKISSYWYNVFIGAIIIISILVNAIQEIKSRNSIVRVNVEN